MTCERSSKLRERRALSRSAQLGRWLALAAMILTSASLTACTHVRPWERGKLAHPTMVGPNLPGVAEEHVYSVQEGAIGGGGNAESGCGCN